MSYDGAGLVALAVLALIAGLLWREMRCWRRLAQREAREADKASAGWLAETKRANKLELELGRLRRGLPRGGGD